MLVAVASIKGSPGVTSTALTLASVWPRAVTVVEADPSGGDLAYRCRSSHGGPVYANKGLLTLAAAVRSGLPSADVVLEQSQQLACGVNLVQGVTSAGQARGLSGLWPAMAAACQVSNGDVIVDLGRLDATSPALPLAAAADVILTVASASLESVMHLNHGLSELLPALMRQPAVASGSLAGRPQPRHGYLAPLLIGSDSHVERDCADLDEVLSRAGHPVRPSLPLAHDPKALIRLEEGEKASSRLGRTLLLRRARQVATGIAGTTEAAAAGATPPPAPSRPAPADPARPAWYLPPYQPGVESSALPGQTNGTERSQP